MDKEAMEAISRGQDSVKALKMLNNNRSADPTVDVHLDHIHRSFSLLTNFLLHSLNKSREEEQERSREEEEERSLNRTVDSQFPNLEDGFLWIKYAQSPIKGSPYARSYYKCITAKDQSCNVKKHVQQIKDNPSLFKTTYIGKHLCKHVLNHSNDDTQTSTNMIQFQNQEQNQELPPKTVDPIQNQEQEQIGTNSK